MCRDGEVSDEEVVGPRERILGVGLYLAVAGPPVGIGRTEPKAQEESVVSGKQMIESTGVDVGVIGGLVVPSLDLFNPLKDAGSGLGIRPKLCGPPGEFPSSATREARSASMEYGTAEACRWLTE